MFGESRRCSTIDTILRIARSNARIPKKQVLSWVQSDDLNVQGLLVALIHDAAFYERIQPPLEYDEYHHLMKEYIARCLIDSPENAEYADSRWEAAYMLLCWFVDVWNDPSVPRWALADLKAFLAEMYLQHHELREVLVQRVLEHLFENAEVMRFFADWRKHPVLVVAYQQAEDWAALLPPADSFWRLREQEGRLFGER